jgi:type IV secretion system protein VirB9
MVFVMRFTYPQADQSQMDFTTFEAFPDIEKEPEKYNFRYSIRGSSVIEPIRIFDDGQWTYFEFRDKNADLPAFFNVDSANNEELINFRKRGNYIVVERVSPRFTLRRGPDILCVYNETMKVTPIPEPKKPLTTRLREASPI